MRWFVQQVLFVGIALSCTDASAVWRSVPPRTDLPRYEISEAEESSAHRVYSLVALGDTLTFDTKGATALRIESRPILSASESESAFRLSVDLVGRGQKKYKRRAMAAPQRARILGGQEVHSPLDAGQRLGKINRLNVDVGAAPAFIRVWLRKAPVDRVFLRVVAEFDEPASSFDKTPMGSDATAIGSTDSRISFGADVHIGQAGYDSNPYQADKTVANVNGAAFWPVVVDAGVRARASNALQVGAKYDFDGRFYDDSILNEQRHNFTLTQSLEPAGRGVWQRMRFRFDERLKLRSTTFFGRGESEEFETISDTGDTIAFGDRFDYGEARGRARADVDLSRRSRVEIAASYRRRDYREDYGAFPDIYALDYGEWELGMALEWKPRPRWKVGLGLEQRDRAYREKFARAVDGSELRGETAAHLRRRVELTAEYEIRTRLDVGLHLDAFTNHDLAEGYWDYRGAGMGIDLRQSWRQGHRVRLSAYHKGWGYERASVANDPVNPLREKSRTEIALDGRYRLAPWVDGTFGVVFEDHENNENRFAYTRWTTVAGFAVRH